MQARPQDEVKQFEDRLVSLKQHAKHYQEQIHAGDLSVAPRTDLGFDHAHDPLHLVAETFKKNINASVTTPAGEVKIDRTEVKKIASSLDTHLRQQVNSLIQGDEFDQKAWDAGLNAARKGLQDLYQVEEAKIDRAAQQQPAPPPAQIQQEKDALKKWYEQAKQNIDDIDKKKSDEMVALSRSLYGLYVAQYFTKIASKLSKYQKWEHMIDPDPQPVQGGFVLGPIDFSKEIKEGLYKRGNDPVGIVCRKDKDGTLTASISKKGKITTEDYDKLIDFLITQGHATSLTISFGNAKYADLDQIENLIKLAQTKLQAGIPFYLNLDPNMLSELNKKDPKRLQDLVTLIATHNQGAKTALEAAPADLSHQARLKELDAEIKKVTDQTAAPAQETKDTLAIKVVQLDQAMKYFESEVVTLRNKVKEVNAVNPGTAQNNQEIKNEYAKLESLRGAIDAERGRLNNIINGQNNPLQLSLAERQSLTEQLPAAAALARANNNNDSLLKNDITNFSNDAQAEEKRRLRQP